MYDFDRTFDRHNTEVIKWDRLEKDFGRKDLIPFGIADMDVETLPQITRALTGKASDLWVYVPVGGVLRELY